MFSYYGSKSKIVGCYPDPIFPTIIEPFAGSARYALKHGARPDRNVILNDIDPTIAGIWRYLIHEATPERINSLPKWLIIGDDLRSTKFNSLIEIERKLLGYAIGIGRTDPGNVVTDRAAINGAGATYDRWGVTRERMVTNCPRIRHWEIRREPYWRLPDIEATWFVDPPYCGPAGRSYKYNAINFEDLAEWCRSRKGQVIVCEGAGAEWLPFRKLGTNHNGSAKSLNVEQVWTNLARNSLFDQLCGETEYRLKCPNE